MTKEKQIIAIAELDGWTYYPPFKYHQERIEYTHPERWEKDKQERNYVQQFGAYLTSRDAIILVIEEKQHPAIQIKFSEILWDILADRWKKQGKDTDQFTTRDWVLAAVKAEVSEIVEALLRACGKWEE